MINNGTKRCVLYTGGYGMSFQRRHPPPPTVPLDPLSRLHSTEKIQLHKLPLDFNIVTIVRRPKSFVISSYIPCQLVGHNHFSMATEQTSQRNKSPSHQQATRARPTVSDARPHKTHLWKEILFQVFNKVGNSEFSMEHWWVQIFPISSP